MLNILFRNYLVEWRVPLSGMLSKQPRKCWYAVPVRTISDEALDDKVDTWVAQMAVCGMRVDKRTDGGTEQTLKHGQKICGHRVQSRRQYCPLNCQSSLLV